MSEMVTKLRIISEGDNIFNTETEYIIPLYQRAYAWEDKQLIQLIEDINDVAEDIDYYIGSLIVSKQSNKYEVVDGQQRLTSLYLLLNCLGIETKHTLTFACREKSNYTLENIKDLLENKSNIDMDRIESSIQRGVKILDSEIRKNDFDKEAFMKKLAKVVIYRIEVPENTDLNRYFEIMNTRGEQLEQHDILKAKLMAELNDTEKVIFARIWDACSDMTGYVQMHFSSKNNVVREALFGSEWNRIPSMNWEEYAKVMEEDIEETSKCNIKKIIDNEFKVEEDEGYLDGDIRVRFESIIDFPYFLIHTLKVFVSLYKVKNEVENKEILDELLDDKKLIDSFDKALLYWGKQPERNEDYKRDFSLKFIICLLRTRYLFDKYIVKREYANDNSDGEWSLKSLCVSKQQSTKKPYYSNSKFTKSGEWTTTNDWRTKTNIMIQSALRVSYTSPKVMHWITKLLIWLSEDECKNIENEGIIEFNIISENIAKEAVRKQFFDVPNDIRFAMGVNTPHIVFNYLDYLLWCDGTKDSEDYSDFTFEFRNSVEHWYPQKPSEGTFEQWKDGVDRFGNLCIIQRNVNAKFSNMSPEAKKSTFGKMIAKGSIKLRKMSKLTETNGDKTASTYWKETMYKKHEEEMIKRLAEACGINLDDKEQ